MPANGVHPQGSTSHAQADQNPREPSAGPSRLAEKPTSVYTAAQPATVADATHLLSTTPILPYTPSSRVAKHLDYLTITHPTRPGSAELYPQYAQQFGALNNPTSGPEWEARRRYEAQLLHAMGAQPSNPQHQYTPYPTPAQPGFPIDYNYLASAAQFMPHVPMPSQYQSTSASGSSSSYMPLTPTTSTSAKSPPTPGDIAPEDYFERYLAETTQAIADRKQREKEVPRTIRSPQRTPRNKTRMDEPDSLMVELDSSPTKKRKTEASLNSSDSSYSKPVIFQRNSQPQLASSSRLPQPSPSPSKRRLLMEVELPLRNPALHYLKSPTKHQRQNNDKKGKGVFRSPEGREDGRDDEDWDMEHGEHAPHTSPGSASMRPPVSGSGRTGDRDTRNGYQKLTALMDDVFEAEDDLPYPLQASSLMSTKYFARVGRDATTATLSLTIIRKLDLAVAKIQHRRVRRRTSAVGAGILVASGGCGTATLGPVEWDVSSLSRLLKMLERSVNAAEDLVLFPDDGASNHDERGRPKVKGKKGRNDHAESKTVAPAPAPRRSSRSATRSSSRSRTSPVEDDDTTDSSPVKAKTVNVAIPAAGFDFEDNFARLVEGISAANCALSLLSSDDVPKQIFSEDLISSCLSLIKHICSAVLLPYISAIRDSKDVSSSHLLSIVTADLTRRVNGKADTESPLCAICEATTSAIRNLTALIDIPWLTLSDSLVIQAVYTSTGPIFAGDPHDNGKRGPRAAVASGTGLPTIKSLRLQSLTLLRSIFAKYSSQRQWIIEEVMNSLTKLPSKSHGGFLLRNGQSIHSMSALMLLLIQTCCYGIDREAAKITYAKAEITLDAPDYVKRQADLSSQEATLYNTANESATTSAHAIAAFLLQKSAGVKSAKDSPESDYRNLLETVVKDTLSVLHWPEWPAASILVNNFARLMINALDDSKASAEHNASKSVALDNLGAIAAGLREVILSVSDHKASIAVAAVSDVSSLRSVSDQYRRVFSYLANHAGDDQSFSTARDFAISLYAQELTNLSKECSRSSAPPADLLQEISKELAEVWNGGLDDVFGSTTEDEVEGAKAASLAISCAHHGQDLFEPILRGILIAMDGTAVAARTKALKGLMSIVTADHDVLALSNVQVAVKNRLLDSSPAVRDAAIELLGKYVTQHPTLVDDYYPQIGARIADTGLGVRKRVIKLLRTIYLARKEMDLRIDICTKLVSLMGDEDEGVKELASKTIAELWFPLSTVTGASADTSSEETAAIVLAVSSHFREKSSYLHEVFKQMISGVDSASVHAQFKVMSDFAIDRLMNSDDTSDHRVVNCIKTVHILSSAVPSIIGVSEASQLLTFLRNPVNAEDQITSDLLLGIFSTSIPCLPKTASTFAKDLTGRLLPMIGKPSGGQGLLKDAVCCLCKVVTCLSKDYSRLITMLKSCDVKLQKALKAFIEANAIPEETSKPVITLMFIAALLVEHCDFDQVRKEHDELRDAINNVSLDSISDYMFDTFLDYTQLDLGTAAQIKIMSCLGALFRSRATLMTTEPATEWMDKTFETGSPEVKSQLLRMIQDVLVAESGKQPVVATPTTSKGRAARSSGTTTTFDMTDLVGSAIGLQESGVSTAIVQRYLTIVLEMAVSTSLSVQRTAVEVLSFTVTQGLAHPLQCLPIIISLETSEIPFFAERALALHSSLHAKHPTLISIRFVEFTRAAYEYQITRKPAAEIFGYRTSERSVAILQGWYGLVREKRAWRQDMLKALGKVFSVDPMKATTTVADLCFVRFVAENLSTFDYKTVEEVLTVIHFLTATLASSIVALMEVFEDGSLVDPEGDDLEGVLYAVDTGLTLNASHLANSSAIIGIALLLKDQLKTLYGLSEDKCTKFVLGKKSATGDKPAVKRLDRTVAVVWHSLPSAVSGVTTVDVFNQHKSAMTSLIASDGSLDAWLNHD